MAITGPQGDVQYKMERVLIDEEILALTPISAIHAEKRLVTQARIEEASDWHHAHTDPFGWGKDRLNQLTAVLAEIDKEPTC